MNEYKEGSVVPEEDEELQQPKRKGKFWGKFFLSLFSFLLGIIFTVGGVALALYKVPVDKATSLVGLDISQYLEKEYAEKSVIGILGSTGDVINKLSDGTGTLQDLDNISPQVEKGVNKLSSSMTKYGLKVNGEELMITPFSNMESFFKNAVESSYVADLLSNMLDPKESAILMAICYGTKNVDYIIDPNNEVQMLNGATPKTIKELKEEGNAIFDDIPLCDLLEVDHSETVMMYLVYGKENIHYTLTADDQVVMLRQRIGVLGGKAYNEYGELLNGTLNGTSTYTDENGVSYCLEANPALGTVTTADGEATLYYLNTAENEEYYYHSTTFGDLSKDEDLIGNMTNRLTIAEVLGEEAVNNKFLKHVKDHTISSLSKAVDDLTVTQVFDTEVFKMDATKENFVDKNGNPTANPDEYVVNSEWWYLLHDSSVSSCTGSHTDGPCRKSCISDYKVAEMDCLITNMRKNIEGASLNKLKKDGMIEALDSNMLNEPVRFSIAGFNFSSELTANGIPHGSGETMGNLTVEQMLRYVNIIFDKLPA